MAKKQVHGNMAKEMKKAQEKKAKVIISTKNDKGKHAFKETIINQDDVKEFIQQQTS